MPEISPAEILQLNQRLLDAIAGGDWKTYAELCDPEITAFEPESGGHLVQGLDFHRFYFELGEASGPHTTTMALPKVQMLGPDAALVTCVRLVQRVDSTGEPVVSVSQETRIWQRRGGAWRHIHFHRSKAG